MQCTLERVCAGRAAIVVCILAFAVASWGVPVSLGQSRAINTNSVIDTSVFQPNVKPVLQLARTSGEIDVDGDLTDPGWRSASRATNFSENYPGEQTEPPIGVEAWATYDDENVYFAFIIRDDPGAVRANLSDRDQIWQDDYVGVILDTYGDNAWAYFIASNPLGIQGDTRIINNGHEDVTFDIVYSAEGMVTADGYQVEMAIPFRSLRFPDREVQNWNMTFWITHPRQSRAQYTWAAISRDDPCWFCQFGTLTGIRGVSGGGGIEFLPAVTGSQSASLRSSDNPSLGLDNGRVKAEPSLGLKYSVSSNLTTDLAVNPDFSQIEADAAQVDVNTTFALFFPERRPFFQEGSDLYQTRVRTVYTRSINNPIAAGKVTARYGRTSFGFMGGVDRDSPLILPFEEQSEFVQAGQSVSNIFRAKRTFGSSSYLGALITDRRLTDDNGSGSTFGIDSRVRLSNNYSVEMQFVGSHTSEPNSPSLSEGVGDFSFDGGSHTAALDGESFSGFASQVSFERNARHWSFDVDYSATSPTFRADNGFITQNNLHRTMLWTGYTFYFDGIVERVMPQIVTGYWWNFDGVRKDQFLWIQGDIRLKAQTNVGLRWLVKSDERFAGEDFRGLRRIGVHVNSNFSDPVKLGGFIQYGRSIARNLETPEMGRSLDLDVWGTIKPISRMVIEPNFTFARLNKEDSGDRVYSGYILRTRLNFQFTRRLFVRLVTQYNDFSERFEVDPLITYKVNPFTAFYVGSTHDFDTFADPFGVLQSERQIFFKFQYLVRV
jgi:hypothetical protein